ncbi:MAG TPA: GntR family transcriptional regulator [Psychromonas hadalis]|nr:GntR family transcriptional regulator [Psychromonas hadalis]
MYLYQEIAQKIKEVIKNIEPSNKLSDERTLSEEYNVSRSRVRKALAELKDEGHLHIKQGSGIFFKIKVFYPMIDSVFLYSRR